MKILLLSIGTRGDIEPFLAIGEIVKAKGHHVICVFPEQFRDLALHSGLEFRSLGSSFINLLDSDAGKTVLGGGLTGYKKLLAYTQLAVKSKNINKDLVSRQHEIIETENPDRIVYHSKTIYPVIWGLDNNGKNILVSPVPYLHYVKGHTHLAFNSNFGTLFNKLTYSIANFGMLVAIKLAVKWLKLNRTVSRKEIGNALLTNRTIYTISPSLFARPIYWKEKIKVLGYHERQKTTDWKPAVALLRFLDSHDRILFVTFGSMTNPDPLEKTNIFLEILEEYKIAAIINTAAGGLEKPEGYDSRYVHFVSQIPYDWIFAKMYGVIHHGGSGTTHSALKYGCATLIIPHIIDQFVWNKVVYQVGAGPKGIKIGEINRKNLETKILELLGDHSFKQRAEQIADQMQQEQFTEQISQEISQSF